MTVIPCEQNARRGFIFSSPVQGAPLMPAKYFRLCQTSHVSLYSSDRRMVMGGQLNFDAQSAMKRRLSESSEPRITVCPDIRC